jgi:hypothetical protein
MNQRPFVSTQDCTHAELCGKRKASVEQKGHAVRVVDAKFPAPSFVGFPLCVGSKTRTSISVGAKRTGYHIRVLLGTTIN